MEYQKWIDTNWKDSGPRFAKKKKQKHWEEYLQDQQQKAIEKIDKHFTKKPKITVSLTVEGFMSLPRLSSGLPDLLIVKNWVIENTSGEWMDFDSMTYIFVEESDALAFALRW